MRTTSLDALRSEQDPAARAVQAKAYIQEHRQAAADAQQIRDAAILALVEAVGVTAAARTAGVSVSLVKRIRLSQGASGGAASQELSGNKPTEKENMT